MRNILALAALSLFATVTLLSAQVAEDPKREAAIRQCIAEAQKIPLQSSDPNDPTSVARYNAYAACMRRLDQRP